MRRGVVVGDGVVDGPLRFEGNAYIGSHPDGPCRLRVRVRADPLIPRFARRSLANLIVHAQIPEEATGETILDTAQREHRMPPAPDVTLGTV